jgi:hypothetical protein
MEAHHPHHVTHKKKLGEYLLEFFMLFLAVLWENVAKYQLEQTIKRHREKEFIKSIFPDAKDGFITANSFLCKLIPL